MNREEKNYQLQFCEKYFGKGNWEQEVLNHVDVLLKDKRGASLLYIEFKYQLANEHERRVALAQAILTNKKQVQVLDRVALAYRDNDGNDTLELIDCSDNSVMYNNDINWASETPSNPSTDAADRINDRIKGKLTRYQEEQIKELYHNLLSGEGSEIQITERNINVVYNQWKATIKFAREIKDEQELINLFLIDILNGTKYEGQVKADVTQPTLFGPEKIGEKYVGTGLPLFREGTNLSKYELRRFGDDIRIEYDRRDLYAIESVSDYDFFWRKYHRPPSYEEFIEILEHSARLYTDKYRRDTGGEYTPTCFVELQNELLAKHYNLNDYIVCDPCAGVGNLENQFGRDYKPYCYLSTLEPTDIAICQAKNFENAICFDYLHDTTQPQWKYRGETLDIREIARREHRKLMVVMNPPYTRQKGFKEDLAIEFFNKVVTLQPDVIVYYCKTEFFLRSTVSNFVNSGYRIVSHVFSNAKETFKLSEWALSQVIFSRTEGTTIDGHYVTADRYELDQRDGKLHYINTYTYDNVRKNLIKEIEREIKAHMTGMIIGQWSYLGNVLIVSNGGKEKPNKITTHNLKWCLLSKGINFNSHAKYFEWNYLVYRGKTSDIPDELFEDSIMYSLFFKNNNFTNKGQRNYIMPFTAEELGCRQNDLNVLFPDSQDLFSQQTEEPFDFRQFLAQFDFSPEARGLYDAALQVFRYYHHNPAYSGKDWNDSFYDITNAIMGKDVTTFKVSERVDERRITKVKTTKGSRGFGRNTIKGMVPDESLPIFYDFFDSREAVAEKINRELLDAHLLLWKRENIF